MNKIQTNKYRMSTTVETLLDNNKTKWDNIPALQRAVAQLKVLNKQIADTDTLKKGFESTTRNSKSEAKFLMATLGHHFGGRCLCVCKRYKR